MAITKECAICGKKQKPIWKDLPNNSDTWFWRQCDTCWEVVCEDCSTADVEGVRSCDHCEQSRAIREAI